MAFSDIISMNKLSLVILNRSLSSSYQKTLGILWHAYLIIYKMEYTIVKNDAILNTTK